METGGSGAGGGGNERYLRVGEVAALLHVSRQTVTRWAKDGRLPYLVTVGGHRRFPRQAVEQLRRDLEGPPAPSTT